MLAFVAPDDFKAELQELNLFSIFSEYEKSDKLYAYTFSNDYNTLVVNSSVGKSYRYGYTRSGIDYTFDVESIYNPFSVGDIKRYVIVNSEANLVFENPPLGALWIHWGRNVVNPSNKDNTYLTTMTSEYGFDLCTAIRDTAFLGCVNLSGALKLPKNIVTIGIDSFSECTKLVGELVIPDTVTDIYRAAFRSCKFNKIVFGSSVLHVDADPNWAYSTFGYNDRLTELILNNGLLTIGSCIFNDATSLTLLDIPSSVISIGNYSFYNDTALIRINSRNPTPPTGLGGSTFNGINTSTCILHVPVGSIAAYTGAAYWSDFATIIDDL